MYFKKKTFKKSLIQYLDNNVNNYIYTIEISDCKIGIKVIFSKSDVIIKSVTSEKLKDIINIGDKIIKINNIPISSFTNLNSLQSYIYSLKNKKKVIVFLKHI